MGAILSLVGLGGSAAWTACCCGTSACRMCCPSCPTTTYSTATRIAYAMLLLVCAVVAWILLLPAIGRDLAKMHSYVGYIGCNSDNQNQGRCSDEWSKLGVYRIFFGPATFFALMAVFTFKVKSSSDCRSGIHNGVWGLKLLLVAGAITGAFFIDNSFFVVWGWIGLSFSFVFMIIQMMLLVDFAHSWNESWLAKGENGSKCHMAGLLVATVLLYLSSFVATVLLYVYFTKRDGESCSQNKFFISFNMIVGLLAAVISISGRVREALPTSGLLQSGVVVFYTTYLTWSAVSDSPSDCSDVKGSSTVTIVVGSILTFVAVIYASLRTSSASQLGKLGMQTSESDALIDYSGDSDDDDLEAERKHQKVIDNERSGVSYNWSYFHLVFMMASFYLMMVITDWAAFRDGDNATVEVGKGYASVWVKIVSSWITLALYIWSMFAPVIFKDRVFT